MNLGSRVASVAAGLLVLIAAAAMLIGCGQGAVKLNADDKKAFEQASPEIKQAWEKALAADKGTDYLNAQALLESVGQMQLDEAQKQAWVKEREAFNQRLWRAAEANDPAAVKAVQASQGSRNRRPPSP